MGRDADFGSIEIGMEANLIVLDADPRADIKNTQSIYRVIRAGEALPAEYSMLR